MPSGAAPPLVHGANRAGATRREYLDWMRGAAVLLMIGGHLVDSWTRPADRATSAYAATLMVAGMGTVFFLFLAGVAVTLSAGSKARRWGDPAAATRAVVARGLQVFALAFAFRLQAWILGWSSNPLDLLKVDILNVMGPSIAAAAFLWRAGRSTGGRVALFAAATAAAALVTPILRGVSLRALPDPVEAYIVPVDGLSNFVFFPWIGFVFGGALAGVFIDSAAAGPAERRVNAHLAVWGALLAVAAYAGSHLDTPYRQSSFWTSSPAFFGIRLGLVFAATAGAYAWNRRTEEPRWRPLLLLGRSSLFIYWIHVELVYGLISLPLHRSLSLPQAAVAFVLFTGLMLLCAAVKDRAVAQLRTASARPARLEAGSRGQERR